jgi:rSAM/selenodomain-associated transferase 2
MISVIIPTFNEARYLPATFDAIERNGCAHEVIVVDADSFDATVHIALEHRARVVWSSARQRASQMNLGAQSAQGEVFLFLHADTRLPKNALEKIENAMAKRNVVGGGFARRYDSPSWFLRGTCALAGVRTRLSGWFLGDQAIFVQRETFKILGGVRNFNLFEDLDFSRRMRCQGRVVTLRPPVISSARRFSLCRPWRTTWSDLSMTRRYLRGVDPNRLAAKYYAGCQRAHRSAHLVTAARHTASS